MKNYLLFLAFVVFAIACNKPFGNTLENNTDEPEFKGVAKKTLMIILDGAVGREVGQVGPQNIINLADFAIYSWDALNSFDNLPITNQHIWANILNGVNNKKHTVIGESLSDADLKNYPSVFTRLKAINPELKTAAFCASNDLAEHLAADATIKKSFNGDDAATATAAKNELASSNPDFVLAQFHGLDVAGIAGGYKAASPAYAAAVLAIDKYVGEMVAAIRQRASYGVEDWAIIITSAKGSNEPGRIDNAFENSKHNGLFIYYNRRFKSNNPIRPTGALAYEGRTGALNYFLDKKQRAFVKGAGTALDFKPNSGFTIWFKGRFPVNGGHSNLPVVSKATTSAGAAGWIVRVHGGWITVLVGGVNFNTRGAVVVSDGDWHTIVVVVRAAADKRYMSVIVDGVKRKTYPDAIFELEIPSAAAVNTPQNLELGSIDQTRGYLNSETPDHLITDLRLYDTVLDETYLATKYCKTLVDDTDPYFKNLLGYWPLTELLPGGISLDMSGHGHNLTYDRDGLKIAAFNEPHKNLCPPLTEKTYRQVPNSVDASLLVYQWLDIPIENEWKLDGKLWTAAFNDLK